MREAICPFSSIGCKVAPSHKDLEKHLEESTQGHMMLMVRALAEQQELSASLASRVANLEGMVGELAGARQAQLAVSTALQAQVAGLEAQVLAHEKKAAKDVQAVAEKAAKDLKKQSEALEKEAQQRYQTLEFCHKKELNSLRNDLFKSTASHAKAEDVEVLRAELAGLRSAMDARTRIEARPAPGSAASVQAPNGV